MENNRIFTCKVCGYTWKTKGILKNKKPKMCAKRGCRSVLWDRGLDDCKFYVNKRYYQQPIKAKYLSNGCLIALGNPRGKGQKYHSISRDGKNWLLHRWVFFIYNNYLPTGEIMHLCDNTDCINPLHLKAGTRKENEAHKVNVGRSLKGEKNPLALLTNNQAKEIKKLLFEESIKPSEVAKKYNVSSYLIYQIKYGYNWKDV